MKSSRCRVELLTPRSVICWSPRSRIVSPFTSLACAISQSKLRPRSDRSIRSSVARTGDETLELDIVAVAAVEDVVAATADQYVVARAAEQDVVALAADQHVVAVAAVEREADHARADSGRLDDVVARKALNDDAVVGSFGAGDVDLRCQTEHRHAGSVADHDRDVVAVRCLRRDRVWLRRRPPCRRARRRD